MQACIFCRRTIAQGESAVEHIFPEAIGGALTLRNAVCKRCNDRLGHSVDSELCNNLLVQFARLSLGIRGKTGVPNPLMNGRLASNQALKIQYRLDDDGRPKKLYAVSHVEASRRDDGLYVTMHLDVDDMHRAPDILRKVAQRQGITLSEEQIALALNVPVTVIDSPEVLIGHSMHLSSWKMGLVKIAYELGYYWLGEEYLEDPFAENLRRILLSGQDLEEIEDFEGAVQLSQEPVLPHLANDHGLHVGLLSIVRGQLFCHVRVFRDMAAVVPVASHPHGLRPHALPIVLLNAKEQSVRELTVSEYAQEFVLKGRPRRPLG